MAKGSGYKFVNIITDLPYKNKKNIQINMTYIESFLVNNSFNKMKTIFKGRRWSWKEEESVGDNGIVAASSDNDTFCIFF